MCASVLQNAGAHVYSYTCGVYIIHYQYIPVFRVHFSTSHGLFDIVGSLKIIKLLLRSGILSPHQHIPAQWQFQLPCHNLCQLQSLVIPPLSLLSSVNRNTRHRIYSVSIHIRANLICHLPSIEIAVFNFIVIFDGQNAGLDRLHVVKYRKTSVETSDMLIAIKTIFSLLAVHLLATLQADRRSYIWQIPVSPAHKVSAKRKHLITHRTPAGIDKILYNILYLNNKTLLLYLFTVSIVHA